MICPCRHCFVSCWVTLTPQWRLEPYAVKVARTVLRRAASGNRCRLSDKSVRRINGKPCLDSFFELKNLSRNLRDEHNSAPKLTQQPVDLAVLQVVAQFSQTLGKQAVS